MKYRAILSIVIVLCTEVSWSTRASEAHLHLRREGTNGFISVEGISDLEWRFQGSADLVTWTNASALGTVFSSLESMSEVPIGDVNQSQGFLRAIQTAGIYDIAVLRTLSLTFTQTNWRQLLTANYRSASNLIGTLVVDGITNTGVGVRYKGNTSYSRSGQKKSVNIAVDYSDPTAELGGYRTFNLNNAFGDESLMREALYFNVMQNYTVCPKASFAKLDINGEYWGVYSFAQQENGDLINEWFPSNDGDRWKAPSGSGSGPGTGGGGGGGGGFASGDRALKYLGANQATYQGFYELKTLNSTNPWVYLIHAIDVLNNTPTDLRRDRLEDVLAVDRWLWFLAIENIFTDDDSYFHKGADYEFYYEPESGRIHPIEHDGNEVFTPQDVQLSPMEGTGNANRPVISVLLAIPELRQRYCAHMRTVLEEWFNPPALNPKIDEYRALILEDTALDTKKGYSLTAFENDITAQKTFIRQRHDFLMNHAELRPLPPIIISVSTPPPPTAAETATISAEVEAQGTEGLDSVWLYYRSGPAGRFVAVPMRDDGVLPDTSPGDRVFAGTITNFPAGTKVRYYVEARSANSVKAASFSPARAEQVTLSYRVTTSPSASSPVVVNELMALNSHTLKDPQGDYDDWIELRNVTNQDIDLTGKYLSDDPENPRKWPFPTGTTISAGGYLIVWADEQAKAAVGLHANFKLAGAEEQILLVDSDRNLNGLLDSVIFGPQQLDRSYGRVTGDRDRFAIMDPTPGAENH